MENHQIEVIIKFCIIFPLMMFAARLYSERHMFCIQMFALFFMIPFDVYRNERMRNLFKRLLFKRSASFTRDERKSYGPVTIYVLSTLDSIEAMSDSVEIMEGDERRIEYSDRNCHCCRSTLKWTERRIFHSIGAECYACYREKVDRLDLFIYFIVMQFPGSDRDAKKEIFFNYTQLRVEKIILKSDGLVYQKEFTQFPKLLLPHDTGSDGMEWRISGERDGESYVFQLDSESEPIQVRVFGIEYEGVFHEERHHFSTLIQAYRFVNEKTNARANRKGWRNTLTT